MSAFSYNNPQIDGLLTSITDAMQAGYGKSIDAETAVIFTAALSKLAMLADTRPIGRVEIAAMAMQGMLANPEVFNCDDMTPAAYAHDSVAYADALIAALTPATPRKEEE